MEVRTMKKTFTMLMLGALTFALVAFSFVTAQAKPANGVSPQNTEVATSSPEPTDPAAVNGNGINGNIATATSSVVVWDQFCVRKIPYTLLALEQDATFEVASQNVSPTQVVGGNSTQFSCEGVGTFRDKQVVVCHGPQLYSFTLHVNNGGANGTEDFQVPLKGCPITHSAAQATPIP
jgi:hypothetical protein